MRSFSYENLFSFICKVKLITITKTLHLDSLWRGGRHELGNGLLGTVTVSWNKQINANQIKYSFLSRGENQSAWTKTSWSRVENQQTQLKYDAESGNRTWTTSVGGECSHHCASPAPWTYFLLSYACGSLLLGITWYTSVIPICERIISTIIIHQIFSLAHDWSKRVTWSNIPQLKLGNIRGYSPMIFPNF